MLKLLPNRHMRLANCIAWYTGWFPFWISFSKKVNGKQFLLQQLRYSFKTSYIFCSVSIVYTPELCGILGVHQRIVRLYPLGHGIRGTLWCITLIACAVYTHCLQYENVYILSKVISNDPLFWDHNSHIRPPLIFHIIK
jgi:hypothetical protein